jgi:hypothetical protein
LAFQETIYIWVRPIYIWVRKMSGAVYESKTMITVDHTEKFLLVRGWWKISNGLDASRKRAETFRGNGMAYEGKL